MLDECGGRRTAGDHPSEKHDCSSSSNKKGGSKAARKGAKRGNGNDDEAVIDGRGGGGQGYFATMAKKVAEVEELMKQLNSFRYVGR